MVAIAQTETPFYGSSFEVLKDTIKIDNEGVYFHYVHDTFNVVYISNFKAGDLKPRIYKLYDHKGKLRVWGEISTILINGTDFIKDGKWMEFYADGILRSIGYYAQDEPIAYWEYFHPNGRKRLCYNYAALEYNEAVYIIPLGPYEEFYTSGQPKVIGKFKAVLERVSKEVVDPVYQITEMVERTQPVPKKAGVWYFYDIMGELVKKEYFDPRAKE